MNASGTADFSRLIHRYGGRPIGSMQPASEVDIRPLEPALPNSIMMDATHDNETPSEKVQRVPDLSLSGTVASRHPWSRCHIFALPNPPLPPNHPLPTVHAISLYNILQLFGSCLRPHTMAGAQYPCSRHLALSACAGRSSPGRQPSRWPDLWP